MYWFPESSAIVSPIITGLPSNVTAAVSALPLLGDGIYVDEVGFTL